MARYLLVLESIYDANCLQVQAIVTYPELEKVFNKLCSPSTGLTKAKSNTPATQVNCLSPLSTKPMGGFVDGYRQKGVKDLVFCQCIGPGKQNLKA